MSSNTKTTPKLYRVVGYDSFSHEEFPVGEFHTKGEAVVMANSKAGQMTLMYVYGPDGKHIHKAGTF